MTRKQYATVKIPLELATMLDELVENLGYRSRAEIVNDAIRRFIEARKSLEETPPKYRERKEQAEAATVMTA